MRAGRRNDANMENRMILKDIFSVVLYLAIVALAIFLMTHYVGGRTIVTGDSMENTLLDGDNLWIDKLSYQFHEPERYDVVVFPPEEGTTAYFIKRIIGLPGETIRITRAGEIVIDGKIIEEDYGLETIREDTRERAEYDVKLGADEYFVMGDNRNNSTDSRSEKVGNVKRDKIQGKVIFRIFPFSRFGTIPK